MHLVVVPALAGVGVPLAPLPMVVPDEGIGARDNGQDAVATLNETGAEVTVLVVAVPPAHARIDAVIARNAV